MRFRVGIRLLVAMACNQVDAAQPKRIELSSALPGIANCYELLKELQRGAII